MASWIPASVTQPNTQKILKPMNKRTRKRDRKSTVRASSTATTIHRKCKDGFIRPFTYIRGVDASVAKYFRTSKTWGKKKE